MKGCCKLEDFSCVCRLGSGSYGTVYKAFHKPTGKIFAIKKVCLNNNETGLSSSIIREIVLLRGLRHPNIIKLEEFLYRNDKMYLILDYMERDLKQYMNELPEGTFLPNVSIRRFSYQMFQGLLYCHLRNIAHRDLKPQNILINSKGLVKIGDFGLATAQMREEEPRTREVVTLWYRPPEILLGDENYTTNIDVWSMGTIMAEMFNNQPLFPGTSEIFQLFTIFQVLGTPTETDWPSVTHLTWFTHLLPRWKGNHLEEKLQFVKSKQARDLIMKLLTPNPRERMSCEDALRHPYFRDFDRSSVPSQGLEQENTKELWQTLIAACNTDYAMNEMQKLDSIDEKKTIDISGPSKLFNFDSDDSDIFNELQKPVSPKTKCVKVKNLAAEKPTRLNSFA